MAGLFEKDPETGANQPGEAPAGDAGQALSEADIKKAIDEAFNFAQDVNTRYNNPRTRIPQSDETKNADVATHKNLQDRLAAIVGNDQLPQGAAGQPGYSDQGYRASYYLYDAFNNARLVGSKDVPDAVLRGTMKSDSRHFLKVK